MRNRIRERPEMSSVRQGRSTFYTTPVSLYFQLWYMYVIWGIADRYFPNYKSTMYNYKVASAVPCYMTTADKGATG